MTTWCPRGALRLNGVRNRKKKTKPKSPAKIVRFAVFYYGGRKIKTSNTVVLVVLVCSAVCRGNRITYYYVGSSPRYINYTLFELSPRVLIDTVYISKYYYRKPVTGDDDLEPLHTF